MGTPAWMATQARIRRIVGPLMAESKTAGQDAYTAFVVAPTTDRNPRPTTATNNTPAKNKYLRNEITLAFQRRPLPPSDPTAAGEHS